MKAVICERYGPPEVLVLRELDKPTPGRRDILIKVHASTVSSADCRVRGLNVPLGFRLLTRLVLGFNRPRQAILGTELAGVVESVGRDVTKFRVGDPVFAFGDAAMGCHAEYRCLPESGAVVSKPRHLSFSEAATLSFGGTTALSFLRRAKLKSGERVLVIGASGSVGTATVQLARHFGAEVTGVCSTANQALVRSLGAHQVIDYTQEDYMQTGDTYDVIVDTVGIAPYRRSKHLLKKGGRLLMVLASLPDMLLIPWVLLSDKKMIAAPPIISAADLRFLTELAESGKFVPVIDRIYALEQIVDAHRYVDTGRKKGNVVVNLEESP